MFYSLAALGNLALDLPANAAKSQNISQSPEALPRIRQVPQVLPRPEKPQMIQPSISKPSIQQAPPPPQDESAQFEGFDYTGNTQIGKTELDRVTEPYRGRAISFSELLQARDAITQLYVEKGYISSYARLGTRLNNGVRRITIEIVEGKVERIQVVGAPRLQRYIQSRLQLPVFNEAKLLERLRLLQVDPLIRKINADVSTSPVSGQVIITVSVVPAPATTVSLDASNQRPETIGSLDRRIGLTQNNLLGLGDLFEIGFGNTTGSNDFNFRHAVPLHSATLELGFQGARNRIITNPFKKLNIRAKTNVYQLSLKQPLIRRATDRGLDLLSIGFGGEVLSSRTTILGEGFPLSAGADSDGKIHVSKLNFSQDYQRIREFSALGIRSTISLGISGNRNPSGTIGPDSRFLSWQGNVSWIRKFPIGDLFLRGLFQLSDRQLLSVEQFSLGGSLGRGYRPDALLGDIGAFGSAEFRVPIDVKRQLSIVPFLDVGTVSNRGENKNTKSIGSSGLGLQWSARNLLVRLDYAVPFSRQDNLKGDAFSLSVGYRRSF